MKGQLQIDKKVLVLLVTLAVVQLVLVTCLCVHQMAARDAVLIDYTIVVDAGHGGIDSGVSANGVKEADLNLTYAKCLANLFADGGFRVVQTRKTSDGLYGLPTKGFKMRDMQKRKQIISDAQPNVVISVHMNKFSDTLQSGAQVFFQSGNNDGQLLADSLQKTLNQANGKQRQALGGDFYLCRNSPCAAVIVECGFLSNAAECHLLQTEEHCQAVCNAIFRGIMLYLHDAL